MNVVELFAGAGGSALGLEAAGFSHLACIENDPDACETLRAAGLPCIEGDVRDPEIYESSWVGETLLWSSFPCQCWSTAGDRLGAQSDRNGWPWTVDAIDCLEPEWFAAENVTGLRQHKGECASGCLGPDECPRSYFDNVILAQLRERFAWVGWRVLDAADFGVPQHRRRVILVGGPRPIRWPEPTHGKETLQEDLFGRAALPWVSVGRALEVDGRVIGGGRNDSLPHRSPRTFRDLTDEPCTTIAASQVGNAGPWIESGGRRVEEPATGRRRLTVEECATLQDFPPGHPFQGTKTSQYTQVGNAVPPKLAEVVGRSIRFAAASETSTETLHPVVASGA